MNHVALITAVCGLITAFAWGLADFFAARATKNSSPEAAVFWVTIYSALIYSLFFIFQHAGGNWNARGIAYSAASGIFLGAGMVVFYRGLDAGPVSLVSPVGSAYPLVTTLVVVSLFGGVLSGLNVLGIVLVVAGIIATSGIAELKKTEKRFTRGVMYAILTFIIWGFGYAFIGKAVELIGWQKATFVDIWFELVLIVILLPILIGRKALLKQARQLATDKFIIATTIIQLVGAVVFDYGLTKASSTAVITAISASYPVLTVFLALKQLKEKQRLVPLAGAFVTIVGVIVLSLN